MLFSFPSVCGCAGMLFFSCGKLHMLHGSPRRPVTVCLHSLGRLFPPALPRTTLPAYTPNVRTQTLPQVAVSSSVGSSPFRRSLSPFDRKQPLPPVAVPHINHRRLMRCSHGSQNVCVTNTKNVKSNRDIKLTPS